MFSFDKYKLDNFYDEMFNQNGETRESYKIFEEETTKLKYQDMLNRQYAAERSLMAMGITFNVYSENQGTERIMPVDIIPRIVEKEEWINLEKGLIQRIMALNMFIDDVYNDQKILKDGIVPRELIESSKCFLKPCIG